MSSQLLSFRLLMVALFVINHHHVSCFTLTTNKVLQQTSSTFLSDANADTSTITSTTLYSSPYKANGRSRNNYNNGSDSTELNRAKFLLNQARGNLQESEMRATAAENRVAMLQKEIKEFNQLMEGQSGDEDNSGDDSLEGTTASDESETKVKALDQKVLDLKDSIKQFKIKMETEIEKLQTNQEEERAKWQKQQKKLYDDLDKAQVELVRALEEVRTLSATVEELTTEIATIIKETEKEVADLKSKHDAKVESMKNEALEVEKNLWEVNSNLESNLTNEKQTVAKLQADISRVQKEAAEEILAVKRQKNIELDGVRKDLMNNKFELSDKKYQVKKLEEERSHVRALSKIQYRLVKSRIVKRAERIFGRGKK